jgi:hypothetical protein
LIRLFPDGSLACSIKTLKITREDKKDKKSLAKAELPKQKKNITPIRSPEAYLPPTLCDNLPHSRLGHRVVQLVPQFSTLVPEGRALTVRNRALFYYEDIK